MMRHIVLFRRLAGVNAQPELEGRLVARMRGLTEEIDFIRDWRVAANELDRPICWDYILESSFDDAQAVQRYLPHPAHQALVAELKQYFEWVAVDYSV
ncbi:Dabb family protein [Pseudomonas kermanshahensis]|uniref:Dabb family protein n=1 Tax=Pseudomonas kermanshahensis TaxID=2745482 RepID=UPI0023DB853F|nr:Dabb family protein [Pseudomonas kermanshahensis]WEL53354.1 Dabb family protein [Pseudomonas kermanshahensis]